MVFAKHILVSLLVVICDVLASCVAPAFASAVKPTVHQLDAPVVSAEGTQVANILSKPADWNQLQAKAYALGKTKTPPSTFKSPLIVPARNCMVCFPGSPECYDMCENVGEGQYMACPNCRACYNLNVVDDVTRCSANNCRDRGAFNQCMLDINRTALGACVRLGAPNLVLQCAAGVVPTVGLGSFIYCFLSKCM